MPKQTFFNLDHSKRHQIVYAAVEEFAKAPYQDISINHLIRAMQIPTGSFYQYFSDKKDLYFYVLSVYMDKLLEDSRQSGKKINLLDTSSRAKGASVFSDAARGLPYYQELFIDNFNRAPIEIKRDWVYEKIINGPYLELYDFSFLEQAQLDPAVRENKQLLMCLAAVVPSVLMNFCNREQDPARYHQLYHLCVDILKTGFSNYTEGTPNG